MSRWDASDEDYRDTIAGPYVTIECTDCNRPFVGDQTTRICEACWERRELHTSALEVRFMLKALLRSDLTHIKEVA